MSAALLPRVIDSLDTAVDAVLDNIPGDIVLGTPLGIGKPNPFINALLLRPNEVSTGRLDPSTELRTGPSEGQPERNLILHMAGSKNKRLRRPS
jgi:hypothetical protein